MPTPRSAPKRISRSDATALRGTGVLLSGGLDSAVLLADEASGGEVHPIYISVGLAWETRRTRSRAGPTSSVGEPRRACPSA